MLQGTLGYLRVHQHAGVDFGETFTLVFKLVTIHTVLTITAAWNWDTKQLDVPNAFLHGHHKEHVLVITQLHDEHFML
jgi:hypothetical protein